MKNVLIICSVRILLVMAYLIKTGRASFGASLSEDVSQKFQTSAQFNKEKLIFKNRLPGLYEEMYKRFVWTDYFEIFKKGIDRTPVKPLPSSHPNLENFLKPDHSLKVIWLGHSSLLMNLNGKILLVDPIFSGSASPYSFIISRFQPSALKLEELPPIDFVVISHDHYDHLDMSVAKFFKDKPVRYIVPLGVGEHLKYWGLPEDKITELDWWKSTQFGDIEFTAAPAQHFSGRGINDANKTLWASWVIKNEKTKIYFSGDSGYDTHFKEIGQRLGPFDIAFVENGQYNPKWHEVHLLPDETVKAFKDLNAKFLFPIHWGMFKLAYHPWYEPIVQTYASAHAEHIQLIAPEIGQIVIVGEKYENVPWWEKLMKEVQE